jgi:lipopolysaccharide heptosyltransferase I
MKKIFLIKPSALGDIVHSLPFLAAVKKTYPHCEVHWLVAKGLHTFLEGHPLIDRLWLFDKQRWKQPGHLLRTLGELHGLWRDLRRQRFDVSVDLSGLLRSGLLTWAGGAELRLGFSDSNEGSPFFYNKKIAGGTAIHAIDRYLKLAALLGCDTSEVVYPFAPYDAHPPICRELPERYAVFAPSAGKEANRWPAQRFGELAGRLNIPVVVIAGKAEEGVARQVVAASGDKALSIAGRTSLKELVAVIEKAAFFVTNDTGPMHIAAAKGVPVFAIFGPANPVRTGPYGAIHTVIREEMACSPCYRWQPCSHWQCMEKITVDRVHGEIGARFGTAI